METIEKLSFITANLPVVPELAVETLLREGENLLTKTLDFLQYILKADEKKANRAVLNSLVRSHTSPNEIYAKLKNTEGAILEYYSVLQINDLNESQYAVVNQYITAVRYCIRAAKSMKDIQHNFKDFDAAANNILYHQYKDLQQDWKDFNLAFHNLLDIQNQKTLFEGLTDTMREAFHNQQKQTSGIIAFLRKKDLNRV